MPEYVVELRRLVSEFLDELSEYTSSIAGALAYSYPDNHHADVHARETRPFVEKALLELLLAARGVTTEHGADD